jgi:sugar lactone lactonase YvrE
VAHKPELLVQWDAHTGEGPVVDGDLLHWVDIPTGAVHRTNLKSLETESFTLGLSVGAAIPVESKNAYAVAYENGFGLVENGELQPIHTFLSDPNLRMNDAKCDARGRMWAGSCHNDFIAGLGKLHRWDGEASHKVMVENLALPNGLGWNKENTLMYLADSISQKILVSDFDLADDFVPHFRELITIDSGYPDGLAIDAEGCIWLAVWGGGRIISEHHFPVTQASSCAFGADGTLFVTSARKELTEAELAKQPLAGSLFTLATDTAGVQVSKFKEIA